MLRSVAGASLAFLVTTLLPPGAIAQPKAEPQTGPKAEPKAQSKPEAKPEPPLARRVDDEALKWGPCPPIFTRCRLAVLHGDPAKPNADLFLQVAGDTELPPHRHTSAERMMLVTGQLRVKYQGAPAAMLAPGSYAYGPAGRPHRATCVGTRPCTLFIAFEGPVDALPFAGSVD